MAAILTVTSRRESRMKRALVGALALCLGLGPCLAIPASAQTAITPEVRDRIKSADRNGDGRIDRGEFHELLVESFYFRDKNRRGYLVIEDLSNVSPESFKAADKNGDGRLSLEEYVNAFFKDFDTADLDGSGSLTIEELDIYIRSKK